MWTREEVLAAHGLGRNGTDPAPEKRQKRDALHYRLEALEAGLTGALALAGAALALALYLYLQGRK